MRIYLASGFRHRFVLRRLAVYFQKCGHTVVSSWIWLENRPNRDHSQYNQFACDIAQLNFDELRRADAVIIDMRGVGEGNHGGTHTELGLALAWGKRIFLIGEMGNTFHWLPQVELFGEGEDHEELFGYLFQQAEGNSLILG